MISDSFIYAMLHCHVCVCSTNQHCGLFTCTYLLRISILTSANRQHTVALFARLVIGRRGATKLNVPS